jgi:hypothetical protein
MKKNVLTYVFIVFTSLGMLTSVVASNRNNLNDSFTFVEGNISFAIFPNGEFDFYLNQPSNVQVNYNGPNLNISFNSGYNYNPYIQYDRFGAVIQIQNVPIFYDYYGRVTRIGSIHINYNNGRMVRLGGMYVFYNNYGAYAYHRGYINTYNRAYVYNPRPNCFVKPNYDYRVVSYKPYRKNYKEYRYQYNNDYSKNKYYGNSNKQSNKSKQVVVKNSKNIRNKRVVTSAVPKRTNERIAVDYEKKSTNVIKRNAEQLSPRREVVQNKGVNRNYNSRNVQQTSISKKSKKITKPLVTSERVNKRAM